MRLTNLEPKWLMYEGRRVGFIFRSPTKPTLWWQTCFVEQFPLFGGSLPRDDETGCAADCQASIIAAAAPDVGQNWQGCDKACAWTVIGGIEAASFETISVTPSLDGSKGGLWHGFITNGEAT